MRKKFVVRLTDPEREQLTVIVKKLSGTSQKVRRAQILLKADADGPGWTNSTNRRDVWLPHQNGRECPPASGGTRF